MSYILTTLGGAFFGYLVSALMCGASTSSRVEEAYLHEYRVGKESSR